MTEDMAPSCSEDDEVVSDDDGELPAPMPLEMLGGGKPSLAPKPATKPAAKPLFKPPSKPEAAKGTGPKLNPFQAAVAKKKQPPPPPKQPHAASSSPTRQEATPSTEATLMETSTDKPVTAPTTEPTTESAKQTSADEDSDADDAKLTTPAMMPAHVPISEPATAEDDTCEPFDAAKAAEMARKNASGMGTASVHTNGSGQTSAATNVVVEKTPGVVDEALRNLVLMLKGEKNDSIAQMPMCRLLHGLVKDDEGNTWPPYEITLHESRHSQSQRQAWLNEHMLKDPSRLFNTILIFDVGTNEQVPISDVDASETIYHLQAVLPGVMVNPDNNADTAKRMAEYNEAIGSVDWTFAIPVPAQFVKGMYKQHKHGLPTMYDPTNNNVKYQLIAKIEDQCAKNSLWKLIVDKSREGQASVAAANGGSGRGKRVSGVEDGNRKRSSAGAFSKSAQATELSTSSSQTPTTQPNNGQTMLSFSAASPTPTSDHPVGMETARTAVIETAHEESLQISAQNGYRSSSPAPAADQTRALVPSSQVPPQPGFANTPLPWTSISPEWFSVVVPKLPRGFVVEMSAPTAHCSGMVSFKRSTSPEEHDV